MFKTPKVLLNALALVIVLVSASPALAGPPLICFPFDTGSTKLLPWGAGTSNWDLALPSYNLKGLTSDTLRALEADGAVLTRMENLRRATIYAMRDPVIAHEFLKSMIGRALSSTPTAATWFDAGYVVEAYKQAKHLRPTGPFDRTAWAAVDETLKVDGYGFVKKAMAMNEGPSPEMEFAASLMTQGAASAAHRSRANASAARGSFLAANLSKY